MKLADLAGYSDRSVAVIGGTFDPIHYGHLLLAEQAGECYDLDLVLFVPNLVSPLKQTDDVTAAEDRYVMVELAVADNPRFVVCREELDGPSPSYTIQTLRALREVVPAQTQVFFVIGADAIVELLQWHEPDAILAESRVVVATRPGFALGDIRAVLGEERAGQIDVFDMPAIDISSTDIRERASRGEAIRYLTPPAVIDYIRKRGLYGSSLRVESVTEQI